MSTKEIDHGGNAFPELQQLKSDGRGAACNTTFAASTSGGMTMRQFYAQGASGAAMHTAIQSVLCAGMSREERCKEAAELAFIMADAMLAHEKAEREAQK